MAQIQLNGLVAVIRRTRLASLVGPRRPDTPARRVDVEIKGVFP